MNVFLEVHVIGMSESEKEREARRRLGITFPSQENRMSVSPFFLITPIEVIKKFCFHFQMPAMHTHTFFKGLKSLSHFCSIFGNK